MPRSLAEMFVRAPDPRKRKGKVHDLTPMLCLAVVAMLAGRTSLQGIAQFGRDHGNTLAFALGFRRGKTPRVATYSRLFRRLDVDAFEAVLRDWIAQRCPDPGEHFALDGKAVRGSHDGEVPAAHLVAVFAPKVQAVIGQIRVDAKTNEHKAALTLLGITPVKGKIVTGDAMFCQTEVAETLATEGAEYILHVKDNQPTVKGKIADLLDATASFSPLGSSDADVSTARTVGKGHGRIEVRTAHSCPLLKHWLQARGFTKAQQVVRVERVRRLKGEETVSVEYYVTSLDSTRASAFDLMRWMRAHWAIENRSHHVRDVTFGEDGSRVRKGSSAEVMAALRNAVIHLLKGVQAVSTRAATHRMQVHPEEAIALLNSTQCDK